MEKNEIDFNDPTDLDSTMKEHGVEEIKDKTSRWANFAINTIKLFLLWSLIYGLYKQAQWIFN